MATKRSVLWSKEMHSPSEIKEHFRDKFPIIVMVARGYYGQTEIDTLGSDQVLILQGWSSQKRVVARDTRNRYISIPADYPLKFEVTHKKDQDLYLRPVSTRARPLWQIIELHRLPVRVQFDRQVSSCFYVGANTRCTETFGDLELLAVYDENYLKANTINAGKIDSEAITVVPMYMKTHFVIAEGLKGTPPNLWENMRQHYIARVQHLDFDNVNGNMDIMLYDGQVAPGVNYDLLMPKAYVRHPSIAAGNGRFSSDGTIKPCTRTEPKYYPLKTRSSSTSETGENHDQGQSHGQGISHSHGHHAQGHEHRHCQVHGYVQTESLYTGLTHARPRPDQQYPMYSQQTPHSSPQRQPPCDAMPQSSYQQGTGELTSHNQGELVAALQTLSVERRARLSDSSTDSSTSDRSSPAKQVPSPPPPPWQEVLGGRGGGGGGVGGGSGLMGGSPARRPPPTRTRLHSESDSGKGSQYTVEDRASSDDSDDVFYNGDDRSAQSAMAKNGNFISCAIRRNRSESDAPRDIEHMYSEGQARRNSSSSTYSLHRRSAPVIPTRGGARTVENVAYFSVGALPASACGRFRALEEVPEDVSCLSVDEVAYCLRLLNLSSYVSKFTNYQVDGELLRAFSVMDFQREFGISIVNAKKLEAFARHGWRPRIDLSPVGSPVKRMT